MCIISPTYGYPVPAILPLGGAKRKRERGGGGELRHPAGGESAAAKARNDRGSAPVRAPRPQARAHLRRAGAGRARGGNRGLAERAPRRAARVEPARTR